MPISMAGRKKTWLHSLCVMSNAELLSHKRDGRQACQMNMTHYIDPHDTQMGQKEKVAQYGLVATVTW